MDALSIARVAVDAGLRDPVNLARAVAIALAESGGNPRAHNRVPPDDSYGLWQINMLGALGPARRQQFGLSTNDQLYDPAINARAMMAISAGGTNWRPWSTWPVRAALYLPVGTAAAGAALAGRGAAVVGESAKKAGEAASDAVSAAGDVLGAARTGVGQLVKAGEWLSDRNNINRVGKVAVGAGLVVAGLVVVAGGNIGTVAGKVLPVGKIMRGTK